MKTILFLFLSSYAVASEKKPIVSFSGPIIDGYVGSVYFDEASRSALAPPPIDDMKITLSYDKKTGESKIIEPTPIQKWLQDEFTALGWWNFIFLGLIFWLGVLFAWKGDAFGVVTVLVTFLVTFGLMVYAFYER